MLLTPKQRAQFLFWFGIAGILFYIFAPVVFPHAHSLHQPELLPLYSLMIGVGQLIHRSPDEEQDNASDKP